ncbi:diphthine--ammonia ligase-like [Durio zibethinus]|uniref:Diphthine--ammonia ligase n=1 Tax=Durio zibethinus TaxID=66656 RepID=A0A6P5Z242_DURZI|nr:diphthine--ammonia ligase-like [Durio zibethinus]XP_022746808.1 diphthine--ammonia ligase-like [Durio zibethinus]
MALWLSQSMLQPWGWTLAKHLGKEIAFLKTYLHKLKDLYGINVCGEGGKYETLTLDRPLFHNARIIIDEFQVVLHSSDSIAPVGVLHPLKFHLERQASSLSSVYDKTNDICGENMSSAYEVQVENPQECKAPSESVPEVSDLVDVSSNQLHIFKTEKDNTFSICCRLRDPSEPSLGKRK